MQFVFTVVESSNTSKSFPFVILFSYLALLSLYRLSIDELNGSNVLSLNRSIKMIVVADYMICLLRTINKYI